MIREMWRPQTARHTQDARNIRTGEAQRMDPAEQLIQTSKLVEPHLTRWGAR